MSTWKSILAVAFAAALCQSALAAGLTVVVGQMANGGGGHVKLMNERGDCLEGWRAVHSTDEVGEVRFRGCWAARADKIGILWQDGEGRVYPRAAFGLGASL